MTERNSRESAERSAQSLARNPQDQRFRLPDLRSRYAATGRVALALLLSVATLAIVVVASGVNMSDADASGGVERVQKPR